MKFDSSPSSYINRIARIQRNYIAELLTTIGLYPGQEALFIILEKQNGQSVGELAKKLGVRPPTVTKMVNRLAAQGYVERKISKSSSNQSQIVLSEAGLLLVNEIAQIRQRAEEEIFGELKAKDQKALYKLLKKIDKKLRKYLIK